MNDLVLSPDQKAALDCIFSWIEAKSPSLSMGGFAGTGKTTLMSCIHERFPAKKIAYCCFTAKAALVLRSKLDQTCSIKNDDFCGTIHSLMYKPVVDPKTGKVIRWVKQSILNYELIVIDEASMVNAALYKDLQSYNIPILSVGDHFQLPPVDDDNGFNLMKNPDVRLEKIHRQAEKSPIISLSQRIRNGEFLRYGVYGDNVLKVRRNSPVINTFLNNTCSSFEDTIILCGFNRTRVKINKRIRTALKRTSDVPVQGDRVICLRNNYNTDTIPIFNGCTGTVVLCTNFEEYYNMHIMIDGETKEYCGCVCSKTFLNESPEMTFDKKVQKIGFIKDKNTVGLVTHRIDYFDYGYAMSVHKSQGSQFDRVMVIEERSRYWTDEIFLRWLYTACTRSKEQLLIVGVH